jgi:hypothetical protein
MAGSAAKFDQLELIAPSPGTGPGVGGSVLYAPIGTPLPTGVNQTLNAAFRDLGYTDENGIRDREERRNTDVFAWGGTLVGNLKQSYARTMTVRFMQFLDPDVMKVSYGTANTTVTPPTGTTGTSTAVALNALLLDTLSWVFQGFYRNALVCKVLPNARVVAVGDQDMTHRAFTTVECTIKAFPDQANNLAYLYTNDGLTTSTTGYWS